MKVSLEPDEWIKDSGCSRHMTGKKSLFSTYQVYDGGNVNLALKAEYGVSDVCFNKILELVNKMLPKDNELPTSTYKAKKLMCPLGLEVTRIDACPRDCILYRKRV